MSNRRVREKKENKQWNPIDEQSYYKANADFLMDYQLERLEFWSEVTELARKTVKRNNAIKAQERHSNMHGFAWQNHMKNKRAMS